MTTANVPEPLIIPRSEHPISRKNIDREALKVMYRLRDAGFSAYLVGGGVRDLFLGKKPKDFDISTDARPGQLRKLFRNSRIIGKRFRLVQVFFRGDKIVEVSTLRCRSEYDINGREEVLASNNTFGSLPEDAFRRDLTINSLFYEIDNFTIIDYTGGVADLRNGIIRIVGEPDRRISRDPVRIMRALRHAARNDFTIEETSWEAIKKHCEELKLCPVSRVRDELLKDLRGGASQPWTILAVASGVFFNLLPFYKGILAGQPEQTEPMGQLLDILGVVDRLAGQDQQIPDSMLLALLMIPWADSELGLLNMERKGEEAARVHKELRTKLAANLAHLNIKRAAKETISGLLANLPLFEKHTASKKPWPKRLQSKSYFNDSLQFYRLFDESRGGKPLTALNVSPPAKTTPRKRSARRASRAPAFTKNKGGVFGLKNTR